MPSNSGVGKMAGSTYNSAKNPDTQIATGLPGNLEPGDQRPEPRRVDELRAAEIDHHPGVAAIDERVQLLAQRRCGHHVEPAGGLDHDDARIECLVSELTHQVPSD